MKKLVLGLSLFPSLLHADLFTAFIAGGLNVSRLDNEPYVALNSFVTNSYQTVKKNDWQGFWGVGISHAFTALTPQTEFSLGIAGYSLRLGKVRGIEYPFINVGLFDPLTYRFQATSNVILAETRLLYQAYNWQPFILAGVGDTANRLKGYQEAPASITGSAVPQVPGFADNTRHNLAYELGFGVQHSLYEDKSRKINYSGSVGYRYFNLGSAVLGALPVQTSATRLQVRNMYTQGIVFTLNAAFN
ncbi:hypothetical protein ACFORL_00385 [Legionella dresdenensis]|uniref:Outer membrane protein beta-barrel domain-containing protein n=1 Tax=Legionella dresdenensis TaxID=450200 RepID=A0ABV8CB73_9GAMM